jgi:hypothetical protein
MIRSIVPARPLQLRRSYRLKLSLVASFILLVGAAFLAGVPALFHEITDVDRDQDVWDHGVPASDGSVEGTEHSRTGLAWLIAWYEFRVTYVDDGGARHQAELELTTALGEFDGSPPIEIRYDPAHPERFALGWAVAARGPRYRGAIAIVVGCGLLGVLLVRSAWQIRRRRKREQQIASDGVELELRVVSRHLTTRRGKLTGEAHYVLEIPSADGVAAPKTHDHKGPLLFEYGGDAEHVLAMILPGDHKHVLVLQEDLAPLLVTEAERDSATACAALSSGPPAPR